MTNQAGNVGKVEGKLLFRSISFLALIIAITFIGAGRIDYWQMGVQWIEHYFYPAILFLTIS